MIRFTITGIIFENLLPFPLSEAPRVSTLRPSYVSLLPFFLTTVHVPPLPPRHQQIPLPTISRPLRQGPGCGLVAQSVAMRARMRSNGYVKAVAVATGPFLPTPGRRGAGEGAWRIKKKQKRRGSRLFSSLLKPPAPKGWEGEWVGGSARVRVRRVGT